MRISVCIATYRRADRLTALMNDLVLQQHLPDEVVIVDNDAEGSAWPVVQQCRAQGIPFPITYEIQPEKNISITRNRTVSLAAREWLAFIDDDERAPAAWLVRLKHAATLCAADGVLGPVEPVVPIEAPDWIQRGRFFEWVRMKTGTVIPANRLRFGNVLLRGKLLRAMPLPFDPEYGVTGGEDGDLLTRLAQSGARIVWCDEAVVREPVEEGRLSLRWLMLRSLRGGQDYARHSLAGRYGPVTLMSRTRLFIRAAIQMLIAAALALLCWPLGHHHAAHWLTKASANLGKLSVFAGWHYREYA